jgi:hypothetical protein
MIMKTRILSLLAVMLFLVGCAPATYKAAPPEEYMGPGSIPPSWYDDDPAYRHWFEPWYVNPYKQ